MTRKALPLETFVTERYAREDYDSLYSGASGVLMRGSHRLMEKGISAAQNERVLEIGGGAMPHIYWMDSSNTKLYTVSDKISFHRKKLEKLKSDLPSQAELKLHDFDKDPALDNVGSEFTRIIASHVLEHIPDPEGALVTWFSKLARKGVLSIAIPCDPGWAWRLGQFIAYRGYCKEADWNLSFTEYDLIMSREHVNSADRLLKILRYYCRKPEIRWFPMIAPVADFNLVCAINIHAADIVPH